jgi:two-component system, OmpR family, response regulator MprA
MRVLVAEDHPEMLEFYSRVIRSDGHDVSGCLDGGAALDTLASSRFDLVVLDLRMPVVDGYAVCRKMRAAGDHTPVLALTGLTSEPAQLEAFSAGADDFVSKPCSYELLLARVRAILRRTGRSSVASLGRWQLNRENLTAFLPDDPATTRQSFSSIEMRVLWRLLTHVGTAVSREDLLATCWSGRPVSDNALAAVAARLRQKLTGSGLTITAVRNRGLMLDTLDE